MKRSHGILGTSLIATLTGLTLMLQADSTDSDGAYQDAAVIKFTYPKDWKLQRRPDKDTLIKVSKDNLGEFTISEMDNGIGLPMPAFIGLLDTMFFAKLKDFKEVKREPVVIGKNNDIAGTYRQIKFKYDNFAVTQDQVFVPTKGNKVLCLAFVEPLFRTANPTEPYANILKSFELPPSLAKASPAVAKKEGKRDAIADLMKCSGGDSNMCPLLVTKRPNPEWTLEEKLQAVLPRAEEERWLQIPWQTNVMAARLQAQQQNKPLFVWIMDGNVLGAT
jgi:hypothetical protein